MKGFFAMLILLIFVSVGQAIPSYAPNKDGPTITMTADNDVGSIVTINTYIFVNAVGSDAIASLVTDDADPVVIYTMTTEDGASRGTMMYAEENCLVSRRDYPLKYPILSENDISEVIPTFEYTYNCLDGFS